MAHGAILHMVPATRMLLGGFTLMVLWYNSAKKKAAVEPLNDPKRFPLRSARVLMPSFLLATMRQWVSIIARMVLRFLLLA